MHRFFIYMFLDNKKDEICIGEGVQFSNETVSIYEYLTDTVIIFNSIGGVLEHYSTISSARIQWVDLLTYTNKIN